VDFIVLAQFRFCIIATMLAGFKFVSRLSSRWRESQESPGVLRAMAQ
jgi:hypothetical protein